MTDEIYLDSRTIRKRRLLQAFLGSRGERSTSNPWANLIIAIVLSAVICAGCVAVAYWSETHPEAFAIFTKEG
ncbi:MAG: hypothetical protein LBE83_01400 [Propionibacteriaceae bacterium]|jgi:hypothetical protein|nr:hypothetical protein [Propionibacteriaceae bacterium]